MAIEGTTNSKDFSASTLIFNLKCRFPKTFRDVQEVVTRDETFKQPAEMKEGELNERLEHALKVVEAHGTPKS
jgi:hypothetical protein